MISFFYYFSPQNEAQKRSIHHQEPPNQLSSGIEFGAHVGIVDCEN